MFLKRNNVLRISFINVFQYNDKINLTYIYSVSIYTCTLRRTLACVLLAKVGGVLFLQIY